MTLKTHLKLPSHKLQGINNLQCSNKSYDRKLSFLLCIFFTYLLQFWGDSEV